MPDPLAGLSIGLAGACAPSRFMGVLLFRVDADDPITFASVALVLLLVSLTATWITARRAACTDPVQPSGGVDGPGEQPR